MAHAETRSRLLALGLGTLLALVMAEGLLRLVMPEYRGVVSGTVDAPNAALYGWGFSPGFEHRFEDFDTGEEVTALMNARGFKDRERSLAKPEGTRRVVVLGDSVTFALVEIEAQYTVLLEELLRADGCPVEVVAVAYGGWATDQQLEALRREALLYAPDVIVSQFNVNDLEGNTLARDNAGGYDGIERNKPFRYQLAAGKLVRIESPAPPVSRRERILRRLRTLVSYRLAVTAKKRLGDWLEDNRQQSAEPLRGGPDVVFEPDAARWQLYRALLLELRRESRAGGADFVLFAEGPEKGLFQFQRRRGHLLVDEDGRHYVESSQGRRSGDFFAVYDELRALAAREDIPFVPIRRTYTRFDNDFHPNHEGNRHMAADLRDFLVADPVIAARLCPTTETAPRGALP